MVSVWHCRHNATITMAHEAASLKGIPPKLTDVFFFKVLERRNMGKWNTFLKNKNILVEFPFLRSLAVTRSAILRCERHSDIFTALQWNLWGWKHLKIYCSNGFKLSDLDFGTNCEFVLWEIHRYSDGKLLYSTCRHESISQNIKLVLHESSSVSTVTTAGFQH